MSIQSKHHFEKIRNNDIGAFLINESDGKTLEFRRLTTTSPFYSCWYAKRSRESA
jgi:hypothetical protein